MSTPSPRKRSYAVWYVVGSAVVIIGILLFMMARRSKGGVAVMTEAVQKRTLIASVTESGTIEPVMEVKIQPDVSGEIVELNFKEGDRVKKGDQLVVIRPDNYRSQLSQTQASLDGAMAGQRQSEAAMESARSTWLQDSVNFRRTDDLYQQKVVSRAEWEAAKLKLEISRSQMASARQSAEAARYQVASSRYSVDQARQNLDRTSIHATMDGTLTLLNRKQGERVVGTMQMEGTEIMRIADLSRMQVVVEINENDIVHLRIGDSARIEVDAYENETFRGTVREIAYSASGAGSALGAVTDQVTNFRVRVEIDPRSYAAIAARMGGMAPDQSPFRPSMSAQVEIFTERADNVLSVPIQAVTLRRDPNNEDAEPREVVYVMEGTQVREVTVKTGLSDDKYIQILSGLTGNEQVVTGPYQALTKTLTDGMTVRLMDDRQADMAREQDKKPQNVQNTSQESE